MGFLPVYCVLIGFQIAMSNFSYCQKLLETNRQTIYDYTETYNKFSKSRIKEAKGLTYVHDADGTKKLVREAVYQLDTNGFPIKVTLITPLITILKEMTRDSLGRITSRKVDVYMSRTVYEYGSNHKLSTKYKYQTKSQGEEILKHIYQYEYDKKSRISRITEKNERYEIESQWGFSYKKRGRKAIEFRTYPDKGKEKKYSYCFDSNNQITSIYKNDVIASSYTYDKNSLQLLEERICNNDGEILDIYFVSYNEKGLPYSRIKRDSTGRITKETLYTYK